MRVPTRYAQLVVLAVGLLIVGGCRNNGGDAGAGTVNTLPDSTTFGPVSSGGATTTSVPVGTAAYNVYRSMLETSLAIGSDFARQPNDGSLDPLMTATARDRLVVNLTGLKLNGITQKGQFVTRLLSSEEDGATVKLKVCSRDDVDQFDKTGKQLTPVGPGVPQVVEVRLVQQSSTWAVDTTKELGTPCDV